MAFPAYSVTRFFSRLRDPRRVHLRRHLLMDVIVIALCAVIAGAKDWQQIVRFARSRQTWLETFLALPNGIPSHDTFERVFERLDPAAFLACFQQWIAVLAQKLNIKHIALDGKTLRGSGNDKKGWRPLHVVSAWAVDSQLSLGQVVVDDKSNEITALPKLLELLDVQGALVTIDAMGCQKAIAKKIISGGGDYLLTVKENHPTLLADITTTLAQAEVTTPEQVEVYETQDKGHGREEKRVYKLLREPTGLHQQEDWENLTAIGCCIQTRTTHGKTSEETRYFIASGSHTLKEYAASLRGHWGIENQLHWQLDVTFREDDNRVQRRNGAENLGLLRRLALSLLRQHEGKESMAVKQFHAALDPAFLEEILTVGANLEKV